MTAEQERYLISILNKSEQDLLFEIANGSLQGITASARPPYETKSATDRVERFRRLLHRVPSGPVSEYSKPTLEPFLNDARNTVHTAHTRLYRLVCDADAQKPNAMALDFSTGQIKDIIVGVATVLLDHYNTAIAVGLPVAVLLLRNGLQNFCAKKPTV